MLTAKLVTLLFVFILIISTGCSTLKSIKSSTVDNVGTNSIEDIQKNPLDYLGKSVTVKGLYTYAPLSSYYDKPKCEFKIVDDNGYYLLFTNEGINLIPGSPARSHLIITGKIKKKIQPRDEYYLEGTDIRSAD